MSGMLSSISPMTPGDLVARAGQRADDEGEDPERHDGGRGALADQRLDPQVVGLVDAEQHDHEQEQHDDGAGVHDDLHRGEEVGLLRHEQHRDAEQRADERQGGVHGVLAEDDPQRPGQARGRPRRRRRTARRSSVGPAVGRVVGVVAARLAGMAEDGVGLGRARLALGHRLALLGRHARRSRARPPTAPGPRRRPTRTARWRASRPTCAGRRRRCRSSPPTAAAGAGRRRATTSSALV